MLRCICEGIGGSYLKVKRRRVLYYIKDMIMLVVGAMLLAIAMHMFMAPSLCIPGGVSGLTIIIQIICDFPSGYSMLIFNLPLVILAFIFLKKQFAIKTTIGVLLASGFLQLFAYVNMYEFYSDSQPILSAIAGGIIGGLGIGLMVLAGGSSGGTEVMSLLIKRRYLSLSMSGVILTLNIALVSLGGVLYWLVEGLSVTSVLAIMICSFVQVFLWSKSIELVLNGMSATVKYEIITSLPDELNEVITSELNRGVTIFRCEGGYSGQVHDMLVCVVTRMEISQLKRILKRVDPQAFVYALNTREVIGKGFRKRQ